MAIVAMKPIHFVPIRRSGENPIMLSKFISLALTSLLGLGLAHTKQTLVNSIFLIQGIFGGPSLGIFFLGVLAMRANGSGALIGGAFGLLVGGLIAFSKALFAVTPLGAPNIASSAASVSGSNFFTDLKNFVGNPNLAPLALNRCKYSPRTKTQAITARSSAALKGSVTLDAAFAKFSALLDQRGFNRQASHRGMVDLGAYD